MRFPRKIPYHTTPISTYVLFVVEPIVRFFQCRPTFSACPFFEGGSHHEVALIPVTTLVTAHTRSPAQTSHFDVPNRPKGSATLAPPRGGDRAPYCGSGWRRGREIRTGRAVSTATEPPPAATKCQYSPHSTEQERNDIHSSLSLSSSSLFIKELYVHFLCLIP